MCTGLAFRIGGGARSTEAELTDHCIAAYEFTRKSNSAMVEYLISMALIELDYQMAGCHPGQS